MGCMDAGGVIILTDMETKNLKAIMVVQNIHCSRCKLCFICVYLIFSILRNMIPRFLFSWAYGKSPTLWFFN